ncbi:MAG: putative xanthine dehydrogenase subunit A [Firmicutes bacterium]|nr:putative xanthine dehydrogenase subunit A [Bacillota bacterium]
MNKRHIHSELLAALEQGREMVQLSFSGGHALFALAADGLTMALDDRGALWSIEKRKSLTEAATGALSQVAQGRGSSVATFAVPELSGEPFLVVHHTPPPTMLICGGGHIAQPLAVMAGMLDFKVVVIDDRPYFASRERFPNAREVICAPFVEALQSLTITAHTYAVIVTRGHRHDAVCLRVLLSTSAAYIGMIGSRRRVNEMKEMLAAEGVPREQLAALHAPIGLAIGAETPAEIATSILAEVVKVKNLTSRQGGGGLRGVAGDLEVLRAIVNAGVGTPLALTTIVNTWGSAPRQAGAQMLVYADGRTVGTIGGGCAESEVRNLALQAMQSEKTLFHTVDMTGSAHEDEGMACGGKMLVHIAPV